MRIRRYVLPLLFAAGTAVMAFTAVVSLLPVAGTLLPVVAGGSFFSAVAGVFASPRMQHATLFTVMQAFCSMLIAAAVGIPAAFYTARRDFPLRRFLLSLSSVPLCTPPLLIALAFVLFYGRNGVLNRIVMSVCNLSEPPSVFLYSFAGIVITQGLYNFPLFMRITGNAWSRLPEEQELAAHLLGASSPRVFFTITFPRLLPAVGAAALPVFLSCFFSFIIVLLFGGLGITTLEVELYQAARATLDFTAAGSIAFVESVIAFLLTAVYAVTEYRMSRRTVESEIPCVRTKFAGLEKVPFILFMLFLAFSFFGPLCTLLLQSFKTTGSNITASVYYKLFFSPSFRVAAFNTCCTGLQTATLATISGLFFALWSIAGMGTRQRLGIQFLAMIPMAVSGVVSGFGWMQLVSHGSIGVLVCAQAAAATPYVMRTIRQQLLKIQPELQQSSALLGRGTAGTAGKLVIPLCRKSIGAGFCFAFAVSAGDATLPLLLGIPGYENLALFLFRAAGSRRMTEAAACGCILAFITALLFFIQDIDNE